MTDLKTLQGEIAGEWRRLNKLKPMLPEASYYLHQMTTSAPPIE